MTALRFQTGGDIRHPQPPFGVLDRTNVSAVQDGIYMIRKACVLTTPLRSFPSIAFKMESRVGLVMAFSSFRRRLSRVSSFYASVHKAISGVVLLIVS